MSAQNLRIYTVRKWQKQFELCVCVLVKLWHTKVTEWTVYLDPCHVLGWRSQPDDDVEKNWYTDVCPSVKLRFYTRVMT